jgi:hypothetical protein
VWRFCPNLSIKRSGIAISKISESRHEHARPGATSPGPNCVRQSHGVSQIESSGASACTAGKSARVVFRLVHVNNTLLVAPPPWQYGDRCSQACHGVDNAVAFYEYFLWAMLQGLDNACVCASLPHSLKTAANLPSLPGRRSFRSRIIRLVMTRLRNDGWQLLSHLALLVSFPTSSI